MLICLDGSVDLVHSQIRLSFDEASQFYEAFKDGGFARVCEARKDWLANQKMQVEKWQQ